MVVLQHDSEIVGLLGIQRLALYGLQWQSHELELRSR